MNSFTSAQNKGEWKKTTEKENKQKENKENNLTSSAEECDRSRSMNQGEEVFCKFCTDTVSVTFYSVTYRLHTVDGHYELCPKKSAQEKASQTGVLVTRDLECRTVVLHGESGHPTSLIQWIP